ncbi:VIT family protein [Blastococcus sp. Marseille-P5729]|uniref:VIT1/CCC1 transporter family protein n=1 Tax=Blastococcus sp. Marseille-P5729 TaxID=2086582 RepID=UPI000D10E8BD|nr:VIT family protein [Blastococcus sp. Marseille-P5729]
MSTPGPGGPSASDPADPRLTHPGERHDAGHAGKLNWLRAGVLGANDGILSQAGLLVGVASATANTSAILTAAVAGLTAGAASMAAGEYVSVSSQRDAERELIAKEARELAEDPDIELAELTAIYRRKGLSEQTAAQVAVELTENDALSAHLDAELHIDPDELTSPVAAAVASAISFVVGSAIPTLAIILSSTSWHIAAVVIAVLVALVTTGYLSARLTDAPRGRAIARLVLFGIVTMGITYLIGRVFDTTVG